jgi:hypothetical protein
MRKKQLDGGMATFEAVEPVRGTLFNSENALDVNIDPCLLQALPDSPRSKSLGSIHASSGHPPGLIALIDSQIFAGSRVLADHQGDSQDTLSSTLHNILL